MLFQNLRKPTQTVSLTTLPWHAPDPYWMEKVWPVCVHVDEALQSNFVCRSQAMSVQEQPLHGTHRFEEPVSKSLKVYGFGRPKGFSKRTL